MVVVAQLVRASDCGSESRRFESGLPPKISLQEIGGLFILILFFLLNLLIPMQCEKSI